MIVEVAFAYHWRCRCCFPRRNVGKSWTKDSHLRSRMSPIHPLIYHTPVIKRTNLYNRYVWALNRQYWSAFLLRISFILMKSGSRYEDEEVCLDYAVLIHYPHEDLCMIRINIKSWCIEQLCLNKLFIKSFLRQINTTPLPYIPHRQRCAFFSEEMHKEATTVAHLDRKIV